MMIGQLPEPWLKAMIRSKGVRQSAPLTPSDTFLGRIPATEYIEALTGRLGASGWFQCPFHKEGYERTPSLKTDGAMWSCFGCEPLIGKQVMGGNIVDFAAILWGYAVPVRGIDLREVMDRLHARFEPA